MTVIQAWTVEQFEDEVRRMDPKVDGRELKAGTVLLAALQEGTREARLVQFTAYPKRTVHEFVERLRKSGVFTEDGRIAADWFDRKSGAVSFWTDVCVALGILGRVPAKPRKKRVR